MGLRGGAGGGSATVATRGPARVAIVCGRPRRPRRGPPTPDALQRVDITHTPRTRQGRQSPFARPYSRASQPSGPLFHHPLRPAGCSPRHRHARLGCRASLAHPLLIFCLFCLLLATGLPRIVGTICAATPSPARGWKRRRAARVGRDERATAGARRLGRARGRDDQVEAAAPRAVPSLRAAPTRRAAPQGMALPPRPVLCCCLSACAATAVSSTLPPCHRQERRRAERAARDERASAEACVVGGGGRRG